MIEESYDAGQRLITARVRQRLLLLAAALLAVLGLAVGAMATSSAVTLGIADVKLAPVPRAPSISPTPPLPSPVR